MTQVSRPGPPPRRGARRGSVDRSVMYREPGAPPVADPTAVLPAVAPAPVVADRVVQDRYESRWSLSTFGPGMIMGTLGTLAVVISCFVSWRSPSTAPADIPTAFLFDHNTNGSGPSLLIVLVPLVVILAIGTFMPMGSGLRVAGAILTLGVTGLFVYQLSMALNVVPGASVGDSLDTGLYLAVIGGLFAFVAGFLPSGWSLEPRIDRRGVLTEDDYLR